MADSCCLFGFDQDHSRVHEVTLGEQHVHVFDAGILKQFAGDVDRGLERFQLLLLDLDALAVVLHLGHAVDHLGEGVEDHALVVVDALQLPGVRGEVVGLDRLLVDQRRDQVAGDVVNQGFRSHEQILRVEGLVADAAGDVQPGKEVGPGDLHVEPGSRQLALGLADVGSVLKQLRGHSHAQRVKVQIEESRGRRVRQAAGSDRRGS